MSAAMHAVLALADRLATGEAKVLLTGESGVGKDLVARYIHTRSRRAAARYAAVNCGALADTPLDAELFEHGGTLFLDDVSALSARMQLVLLRFLESTDIHPADPPDARARLDVRLIVATNRNLQEMVRSGAFREDLLYRLRVGQIVVPPLRERRDDIVPLVEHTIARTGQPVTFSEDAIAVLTNYRWPGNVRELENVVEQMAWMRPGGEAGGRPVRAHDLPIRLDSGIVSAPERRRQLADELYAGLAARSFSFWGEIYELFLSRDLTRHDIRELVRRGLITTHGSYRALVALFGMEGSDYKRFLNFLAAHGCSVDSRPFRAGRPSHPARPSFRTRPD